MAKKTVSKEATLEQILFNCRNALRGAGGTEKNRRTRRSRIRDLPCHWREPCGRALH